VADSPDGGIGLQGVALSGCDEVRPERQNNLRIWLQGRFVTPLGCPNKGPESQPDGGRSLQSCGSGNGFGVPPPPPSPPPPLPLHPPEFSGATGRVGRERILIPILI
jgi:hypothetical protein